MCRHQHLKTYSSVVGKIHNLSRALLPRFCCIPFKYNQFAVQRLGGVLFVLHSLVRPSVIFDVTGILGSTGEYLPFSCSSEFTRNTFSLLSVCLLSKRNFSVRHCIQWQLAASWPCYLIVVSGSHHAALLSRVAAEYYGLCRCSCKRRQPALRNAYIATVDYKWIIYDGWTSNYIFARDYIVRF